MSTEKKDQKQNKMKKIKIYTALTMGIIFLAVSCSSSGTDNVVDTTQGVITQTTVDEITTTTEGVVNLEGLRGEERIAALSLEELIEDIFIDAISTEPDLLYSATEIVERKITAENIDFAINKFKQENTEKYNNRYDEQINIVVEDLDTRVRRKVEPLPSHIDPRLRNHWIKYGEGPEGCNPNAPNYHQDACYQYQIGPGKSDPPDDTLDWILWPDGNLLVPLTPGQTCPKWREDPTWVDEGLVPYFALPSNSVYRERNAGAEKYNEFHGYIAAIAIANSSENSGIERSDPSWENCLLYYSGRGVGSTTQALEKGLAGTALDLEGGRYFIPFREYKSYSIFINTVSNTGEVRGYFCSKRTKDSTLGSYTRDGERLSFGYTNIVDEEGYIVEYAQGYFVKNYEGKMRIASPFTIGSDSLTRSCEKDWELIQLERGFADTSTDGVKVINRWYEIPVATAREYTNSNIAEVESAVACLVGTTRNEIFPNLENDRIRHLQLDFDSLTCDEVRAAGKFNNILNLAPSTTERSSYSGGP